MRRYVACIVLFLFVFCVESPAETMQELQGRGVPTVTAEKLSQKFDENPIAVLEHYKEVMITGKIEKIGINKVGEPYISLGIWRGGISIACYFDEKKRSDLSMLKKRQPVTIYAHIQDYVIDYYGNISLTTIRMINCSIVDANPPQQK